MPKGHYIRNKGGAVASPDPAPETETGVEPVTEAVALNETAPKVKTVAMELLKHYVPKSLISIVGYNKEAVLQKGPDGKMHEVSAAEFIDGEPKPAPLPGAGFANKIWAGTVIEVPEPEAKEMRTKKIAEAYL